MLSSPLIGGPASPASTEAAWLTHDGQTFAVRAGPDLDSGVLRLAQALWRHDPDVALLRLRERVHLSAAASPLDRAATQLVARRLRDQAGPPPDDALWLDAAVDEARAELLEAPLVPADLADRLSGAPLDVWTATLRERVAVEAEALEGPRWARHRPIVALLRDADGALIGVGVNRSGRDRSRHAELDLLRARWLRGLDPLPDGSTLLVSLQPCRMCAAAICALGPRAVVVWDEPDPGRLATCTALHDRGGQFSLADLRMWPIPDFDPPTPTFAKSGPYGSE